MEVVFAKIISLVIATGLGFLYYRKSDFSELPADWAAVKKYAGLSALLNFVMRASSQAVLFFISILIDPLKLGFYYLMLKLSAYLIELPVSSITTVLLPTLSREEASKGPRLYLTVSLGMKATLILSAAFSVILVAFGGLFVNVFFPAYEPSTSVLLLFALFFSLSFLGSLTSFYRAINRNDVLVWASFCFLLTTVTLGYFLIAAFGVEGIVLTMLFGKLAQAAYFAYDIRKNAYPISFFPTKNDLAFFIKTLKSIIAPYFFKRPPKKD
ncbi:MAG: hypothetical protein NUV67_01855 [archaeon]|nr:hypothetical protein [archaeon]